MREPAWYGRETLEQIMDRVRALAAERHVEVEDMQSDSEGELVAVIGRARERFDGVVINPAAYTHTSVALRDAIAACGLPVVEVHLTNTHRREPFRHASLTVPVCLGQVMGFGGTGYLLALEGLLRHLQTEKEKESNT
jgi:3-dehydroquinate dehydratase-2